MKIIQVQFTPWDKRYDFDLKHHQLKIGDRVIVKTELGTEMGKVVGIREEPFGKPEPDSVQGVGTSRDLKPILRKATLNDLEKMAEKQKRVKDALKVCQKLIKKYKAPMKLVDARFSFDGSRVTFAFTAKEKIDFRNLVKELTRHFQKSIRLNQVEVRQETRMAGGIGLCGRELCCAKFLKNLGQITTDLIHNQQLVYRGSERLSGPCGRLMCCLAYEEPYYQEIIKDLPAIGSIIETEHGKGEVIGWHILRRSVDVRIDEDTVVEMLV